MDLDVRALRVDFLVVDASTHLRANHTGKISDPDSETRLGDSFR